MKKTFYLDKFGVRVEHQPNKTAAKQAWEAKRDDFVSRAAFLPHIVAYQGYAAIVYATPEGWAYTITCPGDQGARHASCFYQAGSQIAAHAVALGALAQRAWHPEIADDGEFFDDMRKAFRSLTAFEAERERDVFMHVAAAWRAPRDVA